MKSGNLSKKNAGIINCIHFSIGEQQYKGIKHGHLVKASSLYYDHFYIVSPHIARSMFHKVSLSNFLCTN